ncbi:phage tail fiber protein [Proteus mirabilis]|uniref:phage tail fiber protein n=1 Tax=Proteus mirabilis TaxID=584 RepID=UPI0025789BA6|nr:hypothetical protein [Proteus mirabilis]EKU0927435.1 hypothetical protein [Proteus mirabilis]MDM3646672.1 hypothetical protein [Proteus mirabilis]
MIYTTGTVSTVSGSAIVSGTGTKWTVNNPAIRPGTIILIKNGNANFIYMVDRVNSDTELVISQPATFTVKNTSYSINLTEPNSYSDANNRMTAIASDTTYFLRAMDQWMMNNGVVTVELSNGQKVTLDSIKKMQGDIANKLDTKKGGIQRVEGELRLSSAVGAVNQDESNAAWISLVRGHPDIYIKREGKANALFSFPRSAGGELLSNKTFEILDSKSDFYGNGFYAVRNIDSQAMSTIFMGTSCDHPSAGYSFAMLGRANKAFFTTKENGQWYGTYELWNSSNARPDTNGFLKKSSPVLDINPDGTFTTNDESEGATVTRVAQGEYLIEGVLGFNSDAGWGGVDGGIEIPLDVNKQPLIWVDSEVMEDGSILVRTYHRTHPNAPKFARNDIDDYKDGDPIDIPDGRFISVRVQMPEQSIYNVRMREMEEAQKAEERPQ